eukprot:TRINITY_DN31547_c0_g1_i1.p2 TRINITY_DN31547_c0_g1~~TRINITY_DN31547_c0_g1_i1.p2  ORF type:complete len:127 (+),score=46.39 TRINITY_DN31547_c0_g1_i1:155-535(+)
MDPAVFGELCDRLLEDKFTSFVARWTGQHCASFAGTDTEYDHKHRDLHAQYCRLFESRCEALLRQRGVSTELFAEACEKSTEADVSALVEIIAAVGDFSAFAAMMRSRQEQEAEGQCGAGDGEEGA